MCSYFEMLYYKTRPAVSLLSVQQFLGCWVGWSYNQRDFNFKNVIVILHFVLDDSLYSFYPFGLFVKIK